MSDAIYIIRGTGCNMDGLIVTLHDEVRVNGETYFVVHPKNIEGYASKSILICGKYLSKIRDSLNKTFTYKITVEKTSSDGAVDMAEGSVVTTAKNFKISDIVEVVCSDLKAI